MLTVGQEVWVSRPELGRAVRRLVVRVEGDRAVLMIPSAAPPTETYSLADVYGDRASAELAARAAAGRGMS